MRTEDQIEKPAADLWDVCSGGSDGRATDGFWGLRDGHGAFFVLFCPINCTLRKTNQKKKKHQHEWL